MVWQCQCVLLFSSILLECASHPAFRLPALLRGDMETPRPGSRSVSWCLDFSVTLRSKKNWISYCRRRKYLLCHWLGTTQYHLNIIHLNHNNMIMLLLYSIYCCFPQLQLSGLSIHARSYRSCKKSYQAAGIAAECRRASERGWNMLEHFNASSTMSPAAQEWTCNMSFAQYLRYVHLGIAWNSRLCTQTLWGTPTGFKCATKLSNICQGFLMVESRTSSNFELLASWPHI